MSVKPITGKTNTGLIEYAKAQVGLPYWCGTFGQTATKALYEYNKKRLPGYYTANDYESQFGKRVHDCIGLIKGYMWSKTPTSEPEYNASQDVSVETMFNLALVKGTTNNGIKLKDGVLVFNQALAHVGVYDNGYVYEARGHAWGVIKSVYSEYFWTYWCECPYITYSNKPDVDTFNICDLPTLCLYSKGQAVKVWQAIVGADVDGDFGAQTREHTVNFQRKVFPNQPAEWDGVVGIKSWNKGLISIE